MSHKAFKCVCRKRKAFRKYKDINHPAVKSACRIAKSELRRIVGLVVILKVKLGSNIKNHNKSFFAYVRSQYTLDQYIQKTWNISETGKIEPRLLLMTNRKLHTCFRLLPKSTTLNDLEGPLRTLFQNMCVFRSPLRKFD